MFRCEPVQYAHSCTGSMYGTNQLFQACQFAQEAGQRWLRENRTAIKAYNRRIERESVFSDGLRSF